jgi:signal peptidase I
MTPRHADLVAAAAPALLADVLRRYGRVRLRATGTSMRPAIAPGDILLVERCAFHTLNPGDIVLFTDRRRIFAHRLLESRGPFVVTRGDSNWRPDPPTHESQILGRVSAVLHRESSLHSTPLRRAAGLAASEWIAMIARARAFVQRG